MVKNKDYDSSSQISWNNILDGKQNIRYLGKFPQNVEAHTDLKNPGLLGKRKREKNLTWILKVAVQDQ